MTTKFNEGMGFINELNKFIDNYNGNLSGNIDDGYVYNDPKSKVRIMKVIFNDPKSKVRIMKVIFNDPATIVLWSNGEKTVVKCIDGETFDPEKGLAMAIVKYVYGNKGNYYNEIKKWLPVKEED